MVATCNIFKNRFVHGRCHSGYYEKCHVQSMWLWTSNLVEKTITRPTLGRNLRNGVRLRCLAEGILFPQENLQALLVKLYIIDY